MPRCAMLRRWNLLSTRGAANLADLRFASSRDSLHYAHCYNEAGTLDAAIV
jgi:hypothetical protein